MKLIAKSIIILLLNSFVLSNFPDLVNTTPDDKVYHIEIKSNGVYLKT
jgi:hypothetical protein